jgi:N-acetylmuramic acid 6-phosphate etherase
MRITERRHPATTQLERSSAEAIVRLMHREDAKVLTAVRNVLPQVARAVGLITDALARGGRLIYLGAGTSGRLGVLDAVECGPTFGTNRVIGLMAGAPRSMLRPSEAAEDDPRLGARDLRRVRFNAQDVLVGISASGRTPYVIGGMKYAKSRGATVIALTCNPAAPMRKLADLAILPVVGPEIVAGSTRLKSGTAQKLVLNMLSTASMIRWGRVLSGWMITARPTNRKLRERGCDILGKLTGRSRASALRALENSGGRLPVAALMLLLDLKKPAAEKRLARFPSPVSAIQAALEDSRKARRR